MGKIYMTDFEISESYRLAKDQETQVQILAELNAVAKRTMERKLDQLGLRLLPDRKKHALARLDARQAKRLLSMGYDDTYIMDKLEVEQAVIDAARAELARDPAPVAARTTARGARRHDAGYMRLRRMELRRKGLCVWCGKEKEEPGRALCLACARKSRGQAAKARNRVRSEE